MTMSPSAAARPWVAIRMPLSSSAANAWSSCDCAVPVASAAEADVRSIANSSDFRASSL